LSDLRFSAEDLSELERLVGETRKFEDDYLKALNTHAMPDGNKLNVEDVKNLATMRESLKMIQKKRDIQYAEIWKHL
jgi:hypothetical protein